MLDSKEAETKQDAGPDRANEIAELAMKLFLERGYDNTPMSLISKEIGLAKSGVYHHFESKEQILYAVHKNALERHVLPMVRRAEQEPDPEKRLRTFIFEYARDLTQHPAAAVQINEARRLSPKHYDEIKGAWRKSFEVIRGAICELQGLGRCRADLNPTFAAFTAMGSIGWIIYWFDYSRQENGDELAKTIADLFMAGLLAK